MQVQTVRPPPKNKGKPKNVIPDENVRVARYRPIRPVTYILIKWSFKAGGHTGQ